MKAVFIDKDGTLIKNISYNVDPALIAMQPHAIECLTKIQNLGYLIIVISNQSGVARGLFDENQLIEVKTRIREILKTSGITLNGFYYCPHYPSGIIERYAVICDCRKPAPGMIKTAAVDFTINLSKSWMVGDTLDDVEAGNRAGCKTILLDEKRGCRMDEKANRRPKFTVNNLLEAAAIIEQNYDAENEDFKCST